MIWHNIYIQFDNIFVPDAHLRVWEVNVIMHAMFKNRH